MAKVLYHHGGIYVDFDMQLGSAFVHMPRG